MPQNTPVQFELEPLANRDSQKKEAHLNATIIDISATGMGIFTTSKIIAGEYVYFIKDQPNWELPTRGKAVWSFKDNDGFRVGLEFIL